MIIKGVRCPYCKDEIYSEYRHDFKFCKCGTIFIDGGKDYIRTTPDAIIIDIEVDKCTIG
jgi:hypothetical protein